MGVEQSELTACVFCVYRFVSAAVCLCICGDLDLITALLKQPMRGERTEQNTVMHQTSEALQSTIAFLLHAPNRVTFKHMHTD